MSISIKTALAYIFDIDSPRISGWPFFLFSVAIILPLKLFNTIGLGLFFYGPIFLFILIFDTIPKFLSNKPCKHNIYGAFYHPRRCSECIQDEENRRTLDLQEKENQIKQQKIKEERDTILKIRRHTNEFAMTSAMKSYRLNEYSSIEGLRLISPNEFEDIIARLFAAKGFEIMQTPYSSDCGIDILAKAHDELIAIECKKYATSTTVGRPDIQKFESAMRYHGANSGIFFNLGRYSKEATIYAKNVNIATPSPEEILHLLIEHSVAKHLDKIECSLICENCGESITINDFTSTIKNRSCVEIECPNGHKTIINKPNHTPIRIHSKHKCAKSYH